MTRRATTTGSTAMTFGSSVRLEGVTKRFGTTTAVDGIDLEIESGEFMTLLGPSGSGKTTVLKMLAGFERPTSGSIRIGDREVSRLSPAERGIGMVFQHYALFPHLTVADNIAYGLKKRRWPRRERAARVEEMLALVGLEAYAGRRPHELSGGQQQRVALARALATKPQLLLMDEPLGALDRALRVGMSEEIKRLHRETGTTFLYVTHDQEEALLLSDRVTIMRNGRIEVTDAAERIFRAPRTQFVAEFFANCNVLAEAVLERGGDVPRVRYRDRAVPVPGAGEGGGFAGVAFHADAARVLGGTEAPAADELELAGVLDEVLFMGLTHLAMVTLPEGARLRIQVPSGTAAALAAGGPVRLAVPASRLVPLIG